MFPRQFDKTNLSLRYFYYMFGDVNNCKNELKSMSRPQLFGVCFPVYLRPRSWVVGRAELRNQSHILLFRVRCYDTV